MSRKKIGLINIWPGFVDAISTLLLVFVFLLVVLMISENFLTQSLTGKNTVYWPDFFIVYTDKRGKNRAELIEIKPSNQTGFSKEGKSIHTQKASAINQAKWEAAYKWSKGKGIKFRVVTEHEIFSNTVKRK